MKTPTDIFQTSIGIIRRAWQAVEVHSSSLCAATGISLWRYVASSFWKSLRTGKTRRNRLKPNGTEARSLGASPRSKRILHRRPYSCLLLVTNSLPVVTFPTGNRVADIQRRLLALHPRRKPMADNSGLATERVVIIGAGFAGIEVARSLGKAGFAA